MACSMLRTTALMILLLQLPVLAQSSYPKYLVKARIDPLSQKIEGEVKIRPMPSSHFYLHADLSIHAVSIDGRQVAFHQDSTVAKLPYTVGVPVTVEAQSAGEIAIRYSGTLKNVVNGVNMITPELVELAYYAAWYPIFKGEPR